MEVVAQLGQGKMLPELSLGGGGGESEGCWRTDGFSFMLSILKCRRLEFPSWRCRNEPS